MKLRVLLLLALFASTLLAHSQDSKVTPGRYIGVAGGKLWIEECGDPGGQGIVLVHDGLLHSATWDESWPAICARYRALRYDRRGYGRSPEATAPYSEVTDLLAILDTVNLPKAHVVGSSAGGDLAINFTLAHPTRVDKLVLVGAVVGGMDFTTHFSDRGRNNSQPAMKAQDMSLYAWMWAHDRYIIAGERLTTRKKLYDLLVANPQNTTHKRRAELQPPALPRLKEIKAPTLVLTGAEDIPDVQAHAGAICAGISDSRRYIIPGVGHLPYSEEPEQFTMLLFEFFAGTLKTRTARGQ